MKKRYKKFQEDLQNGMSIEDACTKHQISFKEAFENMERPQIQGHRSVAQMKAQKKSKTGEQYIRKIKHRYCIYRKVGEKTRYFGAYTTLKDAVKIRDYMGKHGWFIEKLDQYCKECNVERCTK